MNNMEYEQEKEIFKSNLRICFILIVILCIFCWLAGCAPQKHMYKVTYTDGDTEYFELDYKPDKDAKSIDYQGETILGVEKIERID